MGTVVCCWSAKGGVGTTVVAAALALVSAERSDTGVLLVDLAGDVPAVLGLSDPAGPGVAGWAAAGREVPADALARLAVPVLPSLDLLPAGDGVVDDRSRYELLARLLAADDRTVVVDAGLLTRDAPAVAMAAGATTSLLVTRPCYVGLRRAVAAPLRPSGVVLVGEPGRALDRTDVEGVLGVPVVAELAVDPAVARAVDAGLLTSRLPRGLRRVLRDAA
jgi:MinD-like ATPase involved in chromosome partitioning or flagellar assembly